VLDDSLGYRAGRLLFWLSDLMCTGFIVDDLELPDAWVSLLILEFSLALEWLLVFEWLLNFELLLAFELWLDLELFRVGGSRSTVGGFEDRSDSDSSMIPFPFRLFFPRPHP
jgi:hypothetical protein